MNSNKGFWIMMAIILVILAIMKYIPQTKASETTLNEKIVELWKQPQANAIISTCDKKARISPRHCKIIVSAVCGNESTFGRNAFNHNVCGIREKTQPTNAKALEHFITDHYNKWYYIPKKYTPDKFYLPKAHPITKFCTDELSSNSKVGCPNGAKNSWNTFNLLSKYK